MVLTLSWPFCVQLTDGVEMYWPVRWTAGAAAYVLGPPIVAVYTISSTLGWVLIGICDRTGLVRASGLAADSLRRMRGEPAPAENYVDGMLRYSLALSSDALRACVMLVAGPTVSLTALLVGEALVLCWLRVAPIPGRMSPRRGRARIAEALGRDVLVASGLLDVMMVVVVYRSYRQGGLAGFVGAAMSTLILHTLLKRLNDMRIARERQHAELIATREELAQRQRLAAIGETASVVFHQIGRHHGAIGMFAHLLGRHDDATVREHAGRILTSVDEANRVIDDLRRFREDRALNLYPQSVAALVGDCVAACQPRALERNVAVVARAAADATIPLDRHKLTQAVVNLLDNAIEASSPGGRVELAVSVNGTSVDLRVRDRGTGVAAAMRGKLFTPFCTTKPEGTGLGLALAKELVEAHGGTIGWRDASPGTEFVVTLPKHLDGGSAPSG